MKTASCQANSRRGNRTTLKTSKAKKRTTLDADDNDEELRDVHNESPSKKRKISSANGTKNQQSDK